MRPSFMISIYTFKFVQNFRVKGIIVTRSVAAIKTYDLVGQLHSNYSVVVVLTESAIKFIEKGITDFNEKLSLLNIPIFVDSDEHKLWNKVGNPVLHICLRNWMDIILIAPMSANFLAGISNGFANNLSQSLVRALAADARIVVAPAMNRVMWDSYFTKKHLNILHKVFRNMSVVDPENKLLVCGEVGMGAMASVDRILYILRINTSMIQNRE